MNEIGKEEDLQNIDVVVQDEGVVFDIELEESILKRNIEISEKNHSLLKEYGVKSLDIMGSVGAGKTSILEHIIRELHDTRIAVINGDLTTTIDANRIHKLGATSIQVNTGKECHLDANLIRKALKKLNLDVIDLILIENVGNLICPGEFLLGTDKRMVVVSAAESPWAIKKHPYIFLEASIIAVNKIDVAPLVGIDAMKLAEEVKQLNPSAEVCLTSCRTGEGIAALVASLKNILELS
ncbi:MAG: hydrogenase nickel incorporation protein HypB [Methermicoccaceae archaeon]